MWCPTAKVARAETHADCLPGTFINGEKIMGASSGATFSVQQNIGSVVYHNGHRLDDSDVIHIGKREKQAPGVSRLRLSATGKLLLNFEEMEGAVAFEVEKGKVRVFRDLQGEDIVVPDVKRIDVTGANPFDGSPPSVAVVGDVSIICDSVSDSGAARRWSRLVQIKKLKGRCERVEATGQMKHLFLHDGCLQVTKVTHSVETASGRVATAAMAPPSTETPVAAILLFAQAAFGTVEVDDCRTVQVIDCINADMSYVKWFFAAGECNHVTTTSADVYIAAGSHMKVETMSGDINLNSCGSAVSASGDIHVGDCEFATTSSGDIFVKNSCKKARSSSGDISCKESCDAQSTMGIVRRV